MSCLRSGFLRFGWRQHQHHALQGMAALDTANRVGIHGERVMRVWQANPGSLAGGGELRAGSLGTKERDR